MFQSITALANGVVHFSLDLYYDHAAHRSFDTETVTELSRTPETDRPLIFFRGMLHFEPADPYLKTLGEEGFAPSVFRFSPIAERNHLRQWPENTVDVIQTLVETPALFEQNPIFAGHSAGGFTSYVLAAMAKGASLSGLRSALPDLERIPEERLKDLARRLRRGRFIAISSPLNGVHLTRTGSLVNRWVIEPRAPMLFSAITNRKVDAFYQKLGLPPEDVMDGNILSIDRELEFHGGLFSKASHAVVQGGMRLFSPFLDHEAINDGIVPLDTAFLEGPRQMLLQWDHLKLVETPEAARALARMIRDIEKKGPSVNGR